MAVRTPSPERSRLAEKVFAVLLIGGSIALLLSAFTGRSPGGSETWTRTYGKQPTGAVTPEELRARLATVMDPELGVSIVDLGLVYALEVPEPHRVHLRMTLTVPSCPFGKKLVEQVRAAVMGHPGVERVDFELTFDPAWTWERVAPGVRERLIEGQREPRAHAGADVGEAS